MTNNDVIILNSIIDQEKESTESDLPDEDFFEIFTFEQILKEYELSYEDLDYGRVGNGSDGGIDGFFFFVDQVLIKEEIDPNDFRRKPILDLFVIQSKRSATFSESVFQKINTTIQDIFDLSKDVGTMASIYNEALVEGVRIFRESYVSLSSKHPILKIHYIYASKGDSDNIDPKVKNESELLEQNTKRYFSSSELFVNFFGAKELVELSRLEKACTLSLNFTENFLSKGKDNYVILTNLEDYYNFVVDENYKLKSYIFESNVRDFQGYIEVNKDIFKTLLFEKELDFWWLNNGITVLASKATVAGKTITLDDVQIINGLQTTNCIYRYFNSKREKAECLTPEEKERSLLVKVIIIKDGEARDKIIKATNFQTSIPPASLRATEKVHRDIEQYFKGHDLYYDRRKNYYKNNGKPANKIISIPLLTQILNTILRKEPHVSRARPASLVKSVDIYEQLFNENISPGTYLLCAQILRKITSRFKGQLGNYTNQEKTNLKFQISMSLVIKTLNKRDYYIEDLRDVNLEEISDDKIDEVISEVIDLTRKYMRSKKLSLELSSKSKELTEYLIKNIIE